MKMIVDGMGLDAGPRVVCIAINKLLNLKPNLKIVLLGVKSEFIKYLNSNLLNQIEIINCEENILQIDLPIIYRHRKNSSMMKAIDLIKNDYGHCLISAGNSGAFLIANTMLLTENSKFKKPIFMSISPTIQKNFLMFADIGANLNLTAKEYCNYGIYLTKMYQKIYNYQPKIALISNGTEKHKGTPILQEAYKLLDNNNNINFYGFIEPDKLLTGDVQIILTDGWSGNLVLKSYEGVTKTIIDLIKKNGMNNWFNKLKLLLAKKILKKSLGMYNQKEFASAILVGVDKLVFKAHGGSNEELFFKALLNAYFLTSKLIDLKLNNE